MFQTQQQDTTTLNLFVCGFAIFTLGYLLAKKVYSDSKSPTDKQVSPDLSTQTSLDLSTPSDQVISVFKSFDNDLDLVNLFHSPEAEEIKSQSLEPLYILVDRTDTIILCKTYLYDRQFLCVEDINSLINELFLAICT
jgi:hypothetical protein